MPVISQIGKRSFKVRLLYASIYLALTLGAVTMVYPLMLMLSGSVKSEADSWSIKPYPEFWFDELILFQKYTEAKYNVYAQDVQQAWCKPVMSWRTIEKPAPVSPELIRDFRNWRATIPAERRNVGQMAPLSGKNLLAKNLRSYRSYMYKKYGGELSAYNLASNQLCTSWGNVKPPMETIGRYRNRNLSEEFLQETARWKAAIPPEDLNVEGACGHYALGYLYGLYTSRIDFYNKSHGTSYRSYGEIPFPDRVPSETGLAQQDWTNFVRNEIKLSNIRLDSSLEPAFRKFLKGRHGSITTFNKENNTSLASMEEIPFPVKIDDAPYLRQDFESFIKSPDDCPIGSIRIYSADKMFREFLAGRHGGIPEDYPGLGAVAAATEWSDCHENRSAMRWEFTMRNYLQVLDYLAMHGNGLLNTFIYCSLAVLCALIVNPLAAYALSRFRLPGTYKILLFCMATMAFPGEVTMIPGFLLLKRFPMWPILIGLAVTIAVFLILEKWAPRWKESWRALLSLAAGLVSGAIIFPSVAPDYATTSLLNNFAALVLPGMANGFSIFLLKGFFDSMPKELYEAADIDGAGEWTKFWMLTMNLSKPILAVIALGAFTHSYSAFMMALIIIPDQKMWTIMVWIFQLQSQVPQPVVYASLVIAAIPTFIIFVLCQNVIMRGIVIPTEK
ncbi:MAG: carbohydrate ABC transporter permease [Victivallales bacterium]|jgi:multiple sugar transport system permease protein